MQIRGSELYLTIVSTPPQSSLHEGMWFTTASLIEVAMRLAMLWTVVSFAAQCVLGRLPTLRTTLPAPGIG
jgi:hypothetical protein